MFMMKSLLLFFFTLLQPISLHAQNQTSHQAWGIFRYQKQVEYHNLGAQLQLRYNFESEKLYEEQVNLSYHRSNRYGEWGGIFTLGTEDGFSKNKELRYAFEWESHSLKQKSWSYTIRLRQEFRDFSNEDYLVYRSRMRNQINYQLPQHSDLSVSLSSEFNFYWNAFTNQGSGFSSHRTILSLDFDKNWGEYELGYIHDYREFLTTVENRHILAFTLVYTN